VPFTHSGVAFGSEHGLPQLPQSVTVFDRSVSHVLLPSQSPKVPEHVE
jgi:hypothetical protein